MLMANPDRTALPLIGIALAQAYLPTLSPGRPAHSCAARTQRVPDIAPTQRPQSNGGTEHPDTNACRT